MDTQEKAKGALFGLDRSQRSALLARLKEKGRASAAGESKEGRSLADAHWRPDPKTLSFAEFPEYRQLRMEHSVAERAGILNPFFQCHEGMAKAETVINGTTFLNFSTYDYLDLNGHPAVTAASPLGDERRRFAFGFG